MSVSDKLVRRYSTGLKERITIIPTIYESLTNEEQYMPSKEQDMAPTNKIRSTRFTPVSFLPICLLLQYKKVVVCFYSFNTIMQFIPAISTNNPLVSLIPTIFLILMGMGKELYLECKRLKDDKAIN